MEYNKMDQPPKNNSHDTADDPSVDPQLLMDAETG